MDLAKLLLAANNALGQASLAEAKRLFAQAVQTKTDSHEALIGLARSQNLLGEIDAALTTYRTMQRLAPDTPNLRTWLAELLIVKRDFAEARRLLDAEIAGHPNSAWALSWIGTIEYETGRTDAAKATLQRALAMDGNLLQFRYDNANWMDRVNQPRRALMDLLAVATMNPNFAGAYYGLGSSYAKLGRADLAVQSYERYLQFDAQSEWATKARSEVARLKSAAPAR